MEILRKTGVDYLRKTDDVDEAMEKIGRALTASMIANRKLWDVGMSVLKLNTREYRQICTGAEKIQKSWFTVKEAAFDRGWSNDKMKEVFGENIFTYFH